MNDVLFKTENRYQDLIFAEDEIVVITFVEFSNARKAYDILTLWGGNSVGAGHGLPSPMMKDQMKIDNLRKELRASPTAETIKRLGLKVDHINWSSITNAEIGKFILGPDYSLKFISNGVTYLSYFNAGEEKKDIDILKSKISNLEIKVNLPK
ncbi:MAG: hypothetical protein KGI06_00020 [Candidatus Micrarchaeota archaeon]|nr:hypothetical protein [Candidatus Micrarchaeota archaeon]